jgi:hypothetical protein
VLRSRGFALAGVALLTAACAHPALVRDGHVEGTIVAPTVGTGDDVLAGAELRSYLKKITGQDVPIASSATEDGRATVRIGAYGGPTVRGWTGTAPAPDGFVIETRGQTLWIVGGDARGALYGVYEFLESELGVRWFMPGDLGEDVPSSPTVFLPPVRHEHRPAFEAVSGFIWAGGPGATTWERRIRAQVGPTWAFFGHNWSNIIPPTEANKTAHPEWFALSGGVRTNQLCSAHPDVVRITVEKAREFFDRNPEAILFSISPNDGYGFCEDDRCRAVDALYGVTDGSLTDRFVHYANEVLAELGKTHAGKQVGILAYVAHTAPPRAARPHPNYATLITRMPWEFCHAHSLADPNCEINRRFMDYVRGWGRVTRNLGVYDYYGHFYIFAPWPIVHSIERDISVLRAAGVTRFMSETQQNWANQGINFYIGAKLTWDPGLDGERLLDDYYTRFYGRAAEPMRRYWTLWEDAMVATTAQGHGGYQWLPMFTAELVAQADRRLAEAEVLAASDREKVARRVAFARLGWRFTEAWVRMRQAGDRGDWTAAVAAGEEALARIRDTQGMEPQAFFDALAISQTQAMIDQYQAGRRAEP